MHRMCQHACGCDSWNDIQREILWSDLSEMNIYPQFFDDNKQPKGFPEKFWAQPKTPENQVILTEKHSRSRSRSRDERTVTKVMHGLNKIAAPTDDPVDDTAASSSSGRSREAALADAHEIFGNIQNNMLLLKAALDDGTKKQDSGEKAGRQKAASGEKASRISKKQTPKKKGFD